eukprot:5314229-Pyramimonas_sp.AAC.1
MPGIVHRHVKEPSAEQLETHRMGIDADGDLASRSISDPDTIMEQKTLQWERVWKDPTFDESEFVAALNDTLRRAREEPLEQITADQVRAGLKRMSSGKARGIDNLSPVDLLRMPGEGAEELVALLNACESEAAWPWQ